MEDSLSTFFHVALSTAANMWKKLPYDATDFVMNDVLECASVCLTRIAKAFASSSDQLDKLCIHGLVKQATSLISTSCSGLSTST
ncbi:hypothetical protein Hanom_Chr01g00079611 [Helianthus anomalus]